MPTRGRALRWPVLTFRSAFCILLITLTARALPAQQVPGYEDGIIEVAADRLPPLTIIVLIDAAGAMLVPTTLVLDYLGIGYAWQDRTLTVARLDGGTTRVDAVSRKLFAGGQMLDLAPAELVVVARELYLHVDRIALLTQGEAHLELARLSLYLSRTEPFPAQQRVIAEQRRTFLMMLQRQSAERAVRDTVRYPPSTGIGVIDWELATSGLDPARLTTARLQGGVAVLGGDLNAGASFEFGSAVAEAMRDPTVRYQRVFPRSRTLSQLRFGDIVTTGLFGRFLRGAEISNRPFTRNYELGTIFVRPDLPTGWEYEVFQGNRLLGYAESGSREPVSVPLRAGPTPIQVRMYGPAGQEIVRTLLYQTPVSLLPRHAFEYIMGGGECTSSCERYAHADARLGATSLLTIGGGAEFIEDSLQSRVRPYLVSSFSTGLRATGELTVMPAGLYSGTFAFYAREGSAAHLRASISQPGYAGVSLLPDSAASQWDVEWHVDERLEGARRMKYVRTGFAASGAGERLDRWRASLAASFNRSHLEVRYEHDELQQEPHFFSGRGSMLVPLHIGGHSLLPLLSAGLGVGSVGVRLAEAGVAVQPRANHSISATSHWSRGTDRPAFALSYSARLGSVQTRMRTVSSPTGGGTSAFGANGSIALTHGGALSLSANTRVGYSGVRGTVFVDRDGDGIFSRGDDVVPDAHLLIGNIHVVADDRGRYQAWGLQPYEVASISIDSTRAADPSWTTARAGILVRPAPNTTRRVDIPLIQTRELVGAIIGHADIATTGGLTLEITDLNTGAVMTATTFSDGEFYISRIRPGRYRIAVAQSSLDVLRALAVPTVLEFTVVATGDDPIVELPPIRLRPRT